MTHYHQPLVPGDTYHLFSRAVGNEKLFTCKDNYLFFLQKLKQHTAGVCQLYGYALLPNHFHLVARINEEERIIQYFEDAKKVTFDPIKYDLSNFIMERFSNFLNSYTKAFNKIYDRKGSLFMDYLRRSKVQKDRDLTAYIWYIHKNAVHHQLTKVIGDWKYDSYLSLLSDAPTSLLRNEVIEWFGGKTEFIKFHQQPVVLKINIQDL